MRARPHHRRFTLALVLSIAAHTALFTLTKMKPPELVMAGSTPQEAMTVRLIDVEPSAPPPASTQAQPPLPTPAPPRPVPIPPLPTPRITRRSPTGTEPPPPTPPEPQPPAPRPPAIPELDMAAMIEARRSQRRAIQESQGAGQRPNAPPTPDQLAQANIARNLRMDEGKGVGGVFEILRKSTRTAEFAFNGWRPDTEKRWREVIEVDAGVGGDIELAIVKRMIELIRTHYTGDFRWDSHRLGRVVVLSARPEDQAFLEQFLQTEFFGMPTTKPAYR